MNLEDPTQRHTISAQAAWTDLLVPVFRNGKAVYAEPTLEQIRGRTQAQLAQLPAAVKKLNNPHDYRIGLERSLHERKRALIQQAQQLTRA